MTKKEQLLEQYSNYLRSRNFSESTYKAYMGTIRNYWIWCDSKKDDPNFVKENAVQSYLAFRLHEQKRDFSTVNGDYSSLQWFYKYVLNREWNVRKLIRPKKEKRLFKYITPQQFSKLLDAVHFPKHRLILMMYYSTGLRLSELRNLKWEDISFDEGIIHVRKGKGAKDRIAVLHDNLAADLKKYRLDLRASQELIFEGKIKEKPIAPRSVQWIFREGRVKAGLPKWVTTHVLRHSYATSILKNGTDLLTLKELLGHKKLATTAGYLHLDINHFKKTYNPLSNECINAQLYQ